MSPTQTVTSAVAKRTKNVYSLIESQKHQIARALPRHMDADRLARVAFTVVRQNPQLAVATPESLLGALMTCAQLGLEPGPLGHAHLVPFKTHRRDCKDRRNCDCRVDVTFIPGYRGLSELVRRSSIARIAVPRVVRKGDHFTWKWGLDERLEHTPDPALAGGPTHVYAVARFNDGSADEFDVMTVADVERIRKRSKAANDGPWVTDWDEMAKKTVVRRLCKSLPMSIELSQAIAQDEQVRTDIDPDALDAVPDDPDVVDGEVEETSTGEATS